MQSINSLHIYRQEMYIYIYEVHLPYFTHTFAFCSTNPLFRGTLYMFLRYCHTLRL